MHNSKKRYKPAVIIILFIILFAVFNCTMNYLLLPFDSVRAKVRKVSEESFDTVIVGTSHGLTAFNPEIIANETKESAFNLCIAGEFPIDSLYLVREASRNSTPKRIIYELDPGYWCTDDETDKPGFIYYDFPLSFNKLCYGWDRLIGSDFRYILFPWYVYRDNYSTLKETIALKKTDAYKNNIVEYFASEDHVITKYGMDYIYYKDIPDDAKTRLNLVLWDEEKLIKDNETAFNKMAAYCEKEGIELIVVQSPVPNQIFDEYNKEFTAAHKYFEEKLSKMNVKYYDFNFMRETLENDYDMDLDVKYFTDFEGHMFGPTGDKLSKALSDLIINSEK